MNASFKKAKKKKKKEKTYKTPQWVLAKIYPIFSYFILILVSLWKVPQVFNI